MDEARGHASKARLLVGGAESCWWHEFHGRKGVWKDPGGVGDSAQPH